VVVAAALSVALASCTPGSGTGGPGVTSPAGATAGPNPVAFCGYLDRPEVTRAVAAYLSATASRSPTPTPSVDSSPGSDAPLDCGDAHSGGPLSRGGRFSWSGRAEPSVVVSLDILGGGLPDETLAGESRLDDGTDARLKAWCGVGTDPRAGEVDAFRVVPSDTLPVDITGDQQLVVSVQIRGYPGGSCGAGWRLFRDLTAAGALDEKQFTRS
jgi:hypothetical protein